jgi:hypothetical protein
MLKIVGFASKRTANVGMPYSYHCSSTAATVSNFFRFNDPSKGRTAGVNLAVLTAVP